MNDETLKRCSEILGCSKNSLSEFPTEIKEKLCTCMELYDVSNEESAKEQYEEMERIWRAGTLILGMNEISENMAIPLDDIARLSENEKLNFMFEYAIGTDRDTLMKIIER